MLVSTQAGVHVHWSCMCSSNSVGARGGAMQVADRFLRGMQPSQKLRVLRAAADLLSGKKRGATLERLAAPLTATLDSMKRSEVTALCEVMVRMAREGMPMDAELATAVALHLWSGTSGVSTQEREALLQKLKKGYTLPIQVQRDSRAIVRSRARA
jgi:hypothetical protein